MARLAIVEDHELLAQSLAVALRDDGFEVHVVVPTSHEDVLARVEEVAPDIVLLDLSLGALGSGVPLIPDLRARGADVICVTGETSQALWGACIEAGAVSIMSKTMAFDELLARIRAVVEGAAAISVSEREALLAEFRQHRANERVRLEKFERLTTREREVLQGLVNGQNAEEIATASFVSLTTVRTQIRAIFTKLEVGSQLAAVALAVRSGWMTPPAD
jgi:DNA-binding NarL/FixJ family response regulator